MPPPLKVLNIDGRPAPFRAVVIAEEAILGRSYAGIIRLETFLRIQDGISLGSTSLDLPTVEWVECLGATAHLVRHGLLKSILVQRMRAREARERL